MGHHWEQVEVERRAYRVEMRQDPKDGWWVGLVEELPGCGSQGATIEECRAMVADAIRECLLARQDAGTY